MMISFTNQDKFQIFDIDTYHLEALLQTLTQKLFYDL
jgi:hypothetical protein